MVYCIPCDPCVNLKPLRPLLVREIETLQVQYVYFKFHAKSYDLTRSFTNRHTFPYILNTPALLCVTGKMFRLLVRRHARLFGEVVRGKVKVSRVHVARQTSASKDSVLRTSDPIRLKLATLAVSLHENNIMVLSFEFR